ncbi:hypothetical protein AG74_17 [Vibrio phage AG74]|uniref:Uncharacterized protein n=3 Tax=Thalassavirus TaxID=2948922 RepID=A0A6M9Z0F7_9CAUD|nr:hypothetical protein FDJ20_gp019 [Vibrio phage Thalassa]YP_010107868.1 hypothetical protein KNV05_gp020 [Vibrio phage River4]YP_010108062.1 hypothetical protein KNV06_gp017 [Vibrio phage AG74]AUG85221.1 hypothetical protein THALASSA_19 [Vibrio phage Thalassa]QKN84682.1 hypothetical protein RIVER4_20 [Vibrio phage River4]QKN84876.1 hypothetical protein AG74_17 [Vibrio phage AG74]
MATNTNKRVATKHIRDGIKSNYSKKDYCEICGTEHDLELHHYHTVSLLLKQYAKENGIPISTDEQVLAMRDDFYKAHWHELVDDTVTLCNSHHVKLHQIYSQEPDLSTASKQRRWVKIQRDRQGDSSGETIISTGDSAANALCNYMVATISLDKFKV